MSDRMSRRFWLTHGVCLTGGAALGWLATRVPLPQPTVRADADPADAATPEGRLRKLALELPKLNPSRPTLAPAVRAGDMLYVSGHGPSPRGGKPFVGRLGKDLKLEDGQQAALSIALTTLAVVRAELGNLNKVVRLVKTLGMVNCTPEFVQQPQVIDAFSDLMIKVFGPVAGKGARSAVGMASLPGGIPVEIECIFQVRA